MFLIPSFVLQLVAQLLELFLPAIKSHAHPQGKSGRDKLVSERQEAPGIVTYLPPCNSHPQITDTTQDAVQITPEINMAEAEVHQIGKQLHQALHSHTYGQCLQLLARAKVALLHLNALIPASQTPKNHLLAAREILELGAIVSIRMNNEQSPDSFTRYFQQLQPFYALPASLLPADNSQQSRITGLYLLLLLSTGDYGGFHIMLETLEMARRSKGRDRLEDDDFIQYPVRLEQALMEGSYDRVWQETKGSNVPGEEYAIFSGVSTFFSTDYVTMTCC
jgi:26S proteasome regulatory subunit N12